MAGKVDLVEVVHTGSATAPLSKRRLWSNGELLATSREPTTSCDGVRQRHAALPGGLPRVPRRSR